LDGNLEGFQVPESGYQFPVIKILTHPYTVWQLTEFGITKTMKGHSWQGRTFSLLHRLQTKLETVQTLVQWVPEDLSLKL